MKNENTEKTDTVDWLTLVQNFVSRHFLPLGAILLLPLAIFVPQPAIYLTEKLPLIQISLVTIFCVFGMKFRVAEVKSAVRQYKEIALGLIIILLVTPLIGTNILKLPQFGKAIGSNHVERNISENISSSIQLPMFGPEEFRVGLQTFFISPCSLAVPAIVVTAANANRPITLFVSVVCLLISIFTVPSMIVWLIPAAQNANISFLSTLLRTVYFLLIPLTIGRLLRFLPVVKKTVLKIHTFLRFVSSTAILVIIWVYVSQTSAKGYLDKFSPLNVFLITALGTAICLTFLSVTFVILTSLRLPKASVLALAIPSAARNPGFTIAVIGSYPGKLGDKGLIFFPVIFVYLVMIVILNTFGNFMAIKEDKNGSELDEDEKVDENVSAAVEINSSIESDTSSFCGGSVCIERYGGDEDILQEVAVITESAISENSDSASYCNSSASVEERDGDKVADLKKSKVAESTESSISVRSDSAISGEQSVCIEVSDLDKLEAKAIVSRASEFSDLAKSYTSLISILLSL